MTAAGPSEPPSPASGDHDDDVASLRERLAAAEAKVAELDRHNAELEQEMVRRGVKLSCTRIALSRAKIAFDESTRQRAEMVQDVAHDLRTPLTSIKGAAQNMLDGVAGPLGEDAQEYVEIVREHADRLIGALNWLLEAMRTTSAPMELSPEQIDVLALVQEVARSLLPIAAERGVALDVKGEASLAYADPDRLRSVVENLVGNALKFTSAGGKVEVRVGDDARGPCVRVIDTGVGIEAEDLKRIFERYYRRGQATGSSGLGLVISREIVRLHGGEISACSTPGVGSEFTVRLPRDGESSGIWAS
ncbi:MAG: HAMP domain-containing sensor histidine kinase [Myxococcales bacterium]|nr:HAMP domain-containing sensor histidine kinase [Myxococcales bacterium]MDD9966789.1 HAMP domain-containing sensor histidine kinase [Myxococcales bacterium]